MEENNLFTITKQQQKNNNGQKMKQLGINLMRFMQYIYE